MLGFFIYELFENSAISEPGMQVGECKPWKAEDPKFDASLG